MLQQIEQLESEAVAAATAAADAAALEAWRIAWIGANGRLKDLMEALKTAPKDQKPALGKRLNAMKQALEAAFESRKSAVGTGAAAGPAIDLTEPGLPVGEGRRHILSRTIADIVQIFGRMGFEVAEGPEVEDEWHNFTALNIPEGHPAREQIGRAHV